MKEIILTKGQVSLVDDEDFAELNNYKWFASWNGHTFYACRACYKSGKKKTIFMHRVILGLDIPRLFVDHKDHNGLNNQKENIRTATYSQNVANRNKFSGTSKYIGVHASSSKKNPWRARMEQNGKKVNIGYFKTQEEAALAYNEKVIVRSGEFATLNVIPVHSQ